MKEDLISKSKNKPNELKAVVPGQNNMKVCLTGSQNIGLVRRKQTNRRRFCRLAETPQSCSNRWRNPDE